MPNYKGHLAGGFVVYLVLINFFIPISSMVTAGEWLLCALLGSLFPDIDTKSKGQKIFYKLLSVTLLMLMIQKLFIPATLLSLLFCVPLITSHRGICHNVWFIMGLAALCVFCSKLFFPRYFNVVLLDVLFFCAGVLSHLWLDLGLRRLIRIR